MGLLAGLSPLTSMLQLFVAPHAERIGYRNLMVKGWTSRVMTLIFLALLPLAVGWLPNTYIIVLLVLIMTVFTTLRGIATCSWLPWTTSLGATVAARVLPEPRPHLRQRRQRGGAGRLGLVLV